VKNDRCASVDDFCEKPTGKMTENQTQQLSVVVVVVVIIIIIITPKPVEKQRGHSEDDGGKWRHQKAQQKDETN
jgi:hypothetical protein